jgi:hypothetical protein
MKGGASPLRFLGLVLGGWMCARLAWLAPAWLTGTAEAEPARPLASGAAFAKAETPPPPLAAGASSEVRHSIGAFVRASLPVTTVKRATSPPRATSSPSLASDEVMRSSLVPTVATVAANVLGRMNELPVRGLPVSAPRAELSRNRWSLSAWAFLRRGDDRQLATGGTLGGSQVGARATYALGDRLFASARLYAPLNRASGAEGALGIEAQPVRTIPLRILAERRQAIGEEGRSAFALLVHGGIDQRPLIGPVRVDGYAQAGVVGLRSWDGFVDGQVRLAVPVAKKISLGLGAWGAAQPGVSRVDVGPHASYRLPLPGGTARIGAEWRMRVAGDARPGSGPTLTLSTDF